MSSRRKSKRRSGRKVKLALNERQQIAILKNLSPSQMKKIKMKVSFAEQKGEGIGDIIKFIKRFLPVGKSLSLKVIRDFIKPLIRQIRASKKGGRMRSKKVKTRKKGGRLNLTLAQKRAIIRALPTSTKNRIRKRIEGGRQSGEGIGAIIAAVAKILGPIALEVGPKVISEIVVPLFKRIFKKKKPKGRPSNRTGRGTKLPGAGTVLPGGRKKKSRRRR